MKPGDFFLGLRHLLGVLLPGSIWLLALSLPTAERLPLDVFASFNAQQVAIVLAAAFLLGYAFRGPGFIVGLKLGDWLTTRYPRLTTFGKSSELQPTEETRELLRWVSEKVPKPPEEPDADAPRTLEKYVPAWSKYYVLGRSELGRRLDETEAEINLYTTTVLPLLILLITLTFFWLLHPNGYLYIIENIYHPNGLKSAIEKLIIELTLVAMAFSFAWRGSVRRKTELRDIYLMVLALAGSENENTRE